MYAVRFLAACQSCSGGRSCILLSAVRAGERSLRQALAAGPDGTGGVGIPCEQASCMTRQVGPSLTSRGSV